MAAAVATSPSCGPGPMETYVQILGGLDATADRLEVPPALLLAWINGAEPAPPTLLFWLDDALGALETCPADG